MTHLNVVTFTDKPLDANNELVKSCQAQNIKLHILQPDSDWLCNMIKLRLLWNFLQTTTLNDDDFLLISDAFDVLITDTSESILEKYKALDADVVFSAEANFYFRNPHLNYFYWKHYPRQSTPYHFLNSGNYMGTVHNIRVLLSTVFDKYKIDLDDSAQLLSLRSDQYLMSRFYVDYSYSPHLFPINIKLDSQQALFACTAGRMFATDDIPKNWVEAFYFFRYQRFFFKYLGLSSYQTRCVDIKLTDGQLENTKTKTKPVMLHLAGSHHAFSNVLDLLRGKVVAKDSVVSRVVNRFVRFLAGRTRAIIEYINGGEYSPKSIFRYQLHRNPDFIKAGEQIVSRLEKREPVAFAHFNDGEIDFIAHHLTQSTTELWTGRRQHKYDPKLGQALHESITFESPHFFRGIPCGLCHPALRKTAEDITGAGETVVPAMSLHHNLALMPRLLMALEGREVWFMANPRQDLSFFEHKDIEVNPERVFRLPFRNSHEEFERFKSMKFADEAVVIMTCGMLGKILMPIWIANNPNTSFLALGSSLDDHIQRKYRFRLFPENLPMTKNLYGSKPFLFGPKKTCPECYPVED